MIEIGLLPNARMAQAFIDYLKGLDIICSSIPDPQGVKLFIEHQQDEAIALRELALFLQHPADSKYRQASWDNGSSQIKFNYGSGGLGLLQQFITGGGPLTLITVLVCVLIYIAMNIGFANPVYESLSFFNATANNNYSEFWRIFTPSLMHFSIMHVSFNLLWWWYLGGKIENKLGMAPLMFLLVVGGTLPSVLQYFVSGPNFGGLSGVVYAVVGYTWLMGKRQPYKGIWLPDSYMVFMMIWLVLGFTDILGMPIANGAHMGGLVVGLLQALFDSRERHASNK
ncbi:rhomboid family intramembrane serine protease GlpG [Shewanella intestini]|uniref:Rhomboid family intramembrane serine protease GlpG n=1 Tax=Shewanella intestini TaxID=2017544 RepID=A0ABS5I3M3_9GAMM|nr:MULTISPECIES: rhomboid family intramembrane serine protease GlpG [Shewanella]MBR9728621.1 rhomboid family intramembrane serine protease GlpG [Shewanella intestini]MRG37323.1 rhomboid family intramembrane serine protease GlpG [Shewanella sp. XMDDZSB0408]